MDKHTQQAAFLLPVQRLNFCAERFTSYKPTSWRQPHPLGQWQGHVFTVLNLLYFEKGIKLQISSLWDN